MARISAKIRQRTAKAEKANNSLDKVFKKRGRRAKVRPSEIRGRADNYRFIFNQVWERLWPLLSKAQAEADVITAFEQGPTPTRRSSCPICQILFLRFCTTGNFQND